MTPLRVWPGVVAAVLLVVCFFGLPLVASEMSIFVFGMLAGFAMTGVIFVWWLFFSRAPWVDRIGVLIFMIAALMVTARLVDESIANGFMGRMVFVFGVPVLERRIEGKTWNHPVLIGDILLVRNGQEMTAFRLALAAR